MARLTTKEISKTFVTSGETIYRLRVRYIAKVTQDHSTRDLSKHDRVWIYIFKHMR
jgi:hypothetical protein